MLLYLLQHTKRYMTSTPLWMMASVMKGSGIVILISPSPWDLLWIYCFSAPKMHLSPLNIFPLLAGKMSSYASRGQRRDTAEREGFVLSLPLYQPTDSTYRLSFGSTPPLCYYNKRDDLYTLRVLNKRRLPSHSWLRWILKISYYAQVARTQRAQKESSLRISYHHRLTVQ